MTCTLEKFQHYTSQHQLEVLMDNGVHRHIKSSKPDSSAYHYTITTWPGHLCISGDMGCFVFKNRNDMFEFFRGEPGKINPDYWQEKVQAGADHNAAEAITTKPDFAAYDKRLTDYLEDFIDNLDPADEDDAEKIAQAKHAVEDFKSSRENSEWDIVSRINNWDPSDAGGMELDDFWEGHRALQQYTFHFIWCCYAIVTTISLYDNHKSAKGG